MSKSKFFRRLFVFTATAALGLSMVGVKLSLGADKDSEIMTIMKKGFKGTKTKPSIVKKAGEGKATKEELASLLEYCKDLQKTKAPKGDAKDWDERTAALTKAAEGLVKGDKGAGEAMNTAANCKKCHELHKED